jgi:hypothetical protein
MANNMSLNRGLNKLNAFPLEEQVVVYTKYNDQP